MPRTKKKRHAAFVPRVLLGAAAIGVIPACAIAACGGETSSQPEGLDSGVIALAMVGFDAARDRDGDPDVEIVALAMVGFDAAADADADARDATDARDD
jgi:hypothetical protein